MKRLEELKRKCEKYKKLKYTTDREDYLYDKWIDEICEIENKK